MTLQIQTITGRRIDPWRFRVEDVDLEDIAHSLAHQCRYAGHVKHFYSVAQHCIIIASYMSLEENLSFDVWRAALLHDASEAYLGDVSRPVKHHREMEMYRAVEVDVQQKINEAFGLPPNAHEHPRIKFWDTAIRYWEQKALCHHVTDDSPELCEEIVIDAWPPLSSKIAFIGLLQGANRGILEKHFNRPKDPPATADARGGQALPLGDPSGQGPSVGDPGT